MPRAKRLEDEFDKTILKYLKKDSRISMVKLASAVGIDRRACERRVDKMIESGRIEKFTVQTNEDSIDSIHKWYMLIELTSVANKTKDDVEFCLLYHSCVTWSYKILGKWDYLIRIEHDNRDALDSLISDLTAIPGVKQTITLPLASAIDLSEN